MRLGAHLSIAQGLAKALDLSILIKANTFQYFTRNPRGGAARQIPATEIEAWLPARQRLDVAPVVGHLPYTVNLAAPPGRQQEFARMVLGEDLRRVGEIGGEYIVSHPGRHDGDRAAALARLAALVTAVFQARLGRPGPMLLLESMAGQGKELGSLADLRSILARLDWREDVGVCLDSAHLFAAGWDLRRREECDRLAETIEQEIGCERVRVMHLNDSRSALSSHLDRHARIGEGQLRREGIGNLVRHPFFGSLPLILETTVETYEEYGEEIERVLALL